MSRRDFLTGTAAAAAFMIVPRSVLGGSGSTPPSDRLNIAAIGFGGMGRNNIASLTSENIVALCDVDDGYAAEVFETYPDAERYRDFRRLLENEKGVDAVVIATPDHTHAVIAMMAIQLGKHVFCQKPLTHTVYEARKLAEAAHEAGIASQMGNQGHAGEGNRLICEWIWDGAIGPVREVHTWTNRPIWPQGIPRPKESPPTPATIDWDLWLGPAPFRPYHPAYAPFKWRGWGDFGTGALGDMGCHIIDSPFWALKLSHPTGVEASSTPLNEETYPHAAVVRYSFPARDEKPPVKLTWYSGGLLPPRPEELEEGRRMGDSGGGVIFVGDRGKLMCGTYGLNPRLIPETKMQEYTLPPKTIPRVQGIHEEWIEACKGGKEASSNFSISGPLTEMVLLGNIAIKTGQKLQWDGEKMEIMNVPDANELVHREYRDGWTL
ncbi:MAG: Gfo/Idh/MocA family oxidoreductase [Candidatus Neomarinimicrobiota bacterium]